MTNAISHSELFNNAHALARKLVLMRFKQYRDAFAFALREAWVKAKSVIKAPTQRKTYTTAWAWDVQATPAGCTQRAQSFNVTMEDGTKQLVWLPNSQILKVGTDCLGQSIVRVKGSFFERVKQPELIENFGCEPVACHAVDGAAFTFRDGMLHIGQPAKHYSIYNGPVRA